MFGKEKRLKKSKLIEIVYLDYYLEIKKMLDGLWASLLIYRKSHAVDPVDPSSRYRTGNISHFTIVKAK